MRKIFLLPILSALLGMVVLVSSVLVSPVYAQATRTWVSGVGDDVNPCSRTAPCKTFAGAISKTAAGGAINCLDSGGFGALTITKAISIVCDYVEAGVLVAGTNGIVVSAGASDIVILRGLDIEGTGTGLDGIKFNTGAALHVEKCVIRGFLGTPGNGIHFAPSGTSQLFVLDTIVADNSKAAASAGILIQPTGSGGASALMDDVKMLDNGNGLIVDGSLTTGSGLFIVVRQSTASGNAGIGIQAVSAAGKAPTNVVVSHTAVTTNSTGISSTGPGTNVTMAYSNVSENITGITFTAPAQLNSYQTNQLRSNITANGSYSGILPLE
jgi:hypothetical protein